MRIVRLTWLVSLAASACSMASSGFETQDAATLPGDAGAAFDAPMITNDDAGTFGDANPDVAVPTRTVFYAHTNGTLFEIDASDPLLAVKKVGDFDCVGTASDQATSLTDIAVDKNGKLFGIAQDRIFLDMEIANGAVHCRAKSVPLASRGEFYGASFAPAGTIDPQDEVLVIADSAGDLYRVDTTNGTTTKIGNFGNVPANDGNGHNYPSKNRNKRWELSGDIVFLENNGNPLGFATVRDCPSPPDTNGCSDTDTLIQLDMTKLASSSAGNVTQSIRGQIVRSAQCNDRDHTSYGKTFGVAASGSNIIGFSRTGTGGLVISIDNNRGTACLVSDRSVDIGGGWAGAGVTTLAQVVAPPPK